MCGINGLWMTGDKNIGRKEQKLYEESLIAIDSRGGHATGIYTGGKIIKMPLKAREFLKVVKKLNRNYPIGNREILGHTRFATVGDYNRNKNNHPFESEHFVFAHNGSYYTISGVDFTEIEYYSNDIPETDSWQLLSAIEYYYRKHHDVGKAIEEALNYGYGAFAFWIYSKDEDLLYLFREDNPLHVVQTKGMVMFASEKRQLPKVLQKKAYELKSDYLYTIDRSGMITKERLDIESPTYIYYIDDYKRYAYSGYELMLMELEGSENAYVYKKKDETIIEVYDPGLVDEVIEILEDEKVNYTMQMFSNGGAMFVVKKKAKDIGKTCR